MLQIWHGACPFSWSWTKTEGPAMLCCDLKAADMELVEAVMAIQSCGLRWLIGTILIAWERYDSTVKDMTAWDTIGAMNWHRQYISTPNDFLYESSIIVRKWCIHNFVQKFKYITKDFMYVKTPDFPVVKSHAQMATYSPSTYTMYHLHTARELSKPLVKAGFRHTWTWDGAPSTTP